MSLAARERRVFFVEEPEYGAPDAELAVREVAPNLFVVVPRLPNDTPSRATALEGLLSDFMLARSISDPILWFYTPMALDFARSIDASLLVYDCMDELAAFRGAPPELGVREAELLERADVVFTGGESLYEAKRARHPNVHAFPSSVDIGHFVRARERQAEHPSQAEIGHPRLGFFGVIDERMDLGLLERIADANRHWQLVVVGPVVKIDADTLPVRKNIHYLGQRSYDELPSLLAGWDVALMPFARNESTRFISPTKTLEYLAGGKPVVSTPIPDVVRPFGERGLVEIADGDAFVRAIERALRNGFGTRAAEVDAFLSTTSWGATWARMSALLDMELERKLELGSFARRAPKTAPRFTGEGEISDV